MPTLMSKLPAAAQMADSVAAATCCCSTLCTPCRPTTAMSWCVTKFGSTPSLCMLCSSSSAVSTRPTRSHAAKLALYTCTEGCGCKNARRRRGAAVGRGRHAWRLCTRGNSRQSRGSPRACWAHRDGETSPGEGYCRAGENVLSLLLLVRSLPLLVLVEVCVPGTHRMPRHQVTLEVDVHAQVEVPPPHTQTHTHYMPTGSPASRPASRAHARRAPCHAAQPASTRQ